MIKSTNRSEDFQMFPDQIINSVFEGVSNPENSEAVNTMLDKYGLNWKVEKRPLFVNNAAGATVGTDFFGIVRTDSENMFAACKKDYNPYQNSELAELVFRLSEKTGYSLHSGGSFNGGAKVFIQLETDNVIKGIGANKDTVKGYTTGINSHDGSTSLKWGEANITISCLNTFMYAMKQLKSSARHTEKMRDKVEIALAMITGTVQGEKSLFDTFIKLSEIAVNRANIAQIVKVVSKVDIGDTTLTRSQLESNYSTYALNRMEELLVAINKEMQQKGQTMWGLFNGVTQYTNYIQQVPKRDNARLESLYTGTAFSTNNDSFKLITEMAGLVKA